MGRRLGEGLRGRGRRGRLKGKCSSNGKLSFDEDEQLSIIFSLGGLRVFFEAKRAEFDAAK